MPQSRAPSLSRRPGRLAVLLLVPALLLAACTGDSGGSGASPLSSPVTQTSGAFTVVVSSCSTPFDHGTTTLLVSFTLPTVGVPLHFKDATGGGASLGASPAPLSAATASPAPGTGTGQDVLKMTGPRFDRVDFEHARLIADSGQTLHASSLASLEGETFRGPFGEAHIVRVRIKGSRVVVSVSSPQTPAKGVQSLGPQTATLQVGSQTLTSANPSSGPKGSQYVNDLGFTGTPPMTGRATLTLSSWTLLDLDTLTVAVPQTCQAA